MIGALFWRVAGLSLVCSAVLAPLLLASRFIRRRYSARTCYFLWLLLALRMILPFPLAAPRRAVTVEVPRYEILLPPQADMDLEPVPAKPQAPAQGGTAAPAAPVAHPSQAPARTVSLAALLPGLWLAGMAACGLWLALSYGLARRSLLRGSKPAGPGEEALLDALARELGCKRPPALYRSGRVDAPMLLGLARPVVVLPLGEPEAGELSVMLRHELTHLRRRDVGYKLLMRSVCIVYWFAPLVWWMGREAGRNLELCCDEDVVRGQDVAFRRAYGDMLLKTAAGTGQAPVLSARMGGGKGHLKVRLGNLFLKKKNSAALVGAVLAAALLGGALVSCTAGVPEGSGPAEDQKAVAVSVQGPTGPENIQDEGEGTLADEAALQELEAHIGALNDGVVMFTIPKGQVQDEWQIEIRGRMEVDGSGMSVHYPSGDRIAWEPGRSYKFEFAEQWPYLTELYLSAALGEAHRDIDLLELAAQDGQARPEDVLSFPGEDGAPDPMHGLSEIYYAREKGGFGGNFCITLKADGSFGYYEGSLSSYIGTGRWSLDGDTLCLTDEGMRSAGARHYYFKVEGDALVFQRESSDGFTYVRAADGDRFLAISTEPGPFDPISG